MLASIESLEMSPVGLCTVFFSTLFHELQAHNDWSLRDKLDETRGIRRGSSDVDLDNLGLYPLLCAISHTRNNNIERGRWRC